MKIMKKQLIAYMLYASSALQAATQATITITPATTNQTLNIGCEAKTSKKRITLTDSVQTAFQKRPLVKAMAAATESNRYLQRQTFSNYFPSLTASGSVYEAAGATKTPNSVGLTVNQTIFRFDTHDNYKIAKNVTAISQENEDLAKFQIRNDVENSFLDSWLLQRQYKLFLSILKSTEAQFKQQEARNSVELLDKSVWLHAEADYQTALSNVSQYKDLLHASFIQLEQNMGTALADTQATLSAEKIDAWPTLAWKWNGPVTIHSLEHYYRQALKYRKELTVKDKNIEINKLTASAAYKQYLPMFNLFGSVTRFGNQGTAPTHYANSGGVSLTWNLSDGFSSYLTAKSAESLEIKTIMEKDELFNNIRSDVHVSYAQLMQLHKQLVAQQAILKAAKNDYTLSREQLEVGLVAYVDFQTARTAWFNAEFTWLGLKVQAVKKYCELQLKCGYPEATEPLDS